MSDLLYPQVPCRKDINAFEGKASKHLNRPLPQPAHSRKLLNKLLIASTSQYLCTQLPTLKFLRQPLYILRFALRQTSRP